MLIVPLPFQNLLKHNSQLYQMSSRNNAAAMVFYYFFKRLSQSLIIMAAEMGHLVLGTLHTTDASQTVDRIIDSFPHGQQRQIRLQLS